MKTLLSSPLGVYSMTDTDRAAVDLFERLASEDAFAHTPKDAGAKRPVVKPAWQRLRLAQAEDPLLRETREFIDAELARRAAAQQDEAEPSGS